MTSHITFKRKNIQKNSKRDNHDQVTDQVKILRFCKNAKTRAEIIDFVGLKHNPTFRSNYLKPLLKQVY